MNLSKLIVPLALFPAALSAQTTVYSSNFSTGSVNPAQNSYQTGDWAVLSSRNNSQNTISYATNAFSFGMTDGSSALVEAQSRFSNTPVSLTGVGSYVQLNIVFTATNNILVAGSTSTTLNVGLYDATSGGDPVTSLANGGLGATSKPTGFETGFAAGWEGYIGRFGHSGSQTNFIKTRPAQTGEVSASTEAQDLVFADGVTGGFDTPDGAQLASAASTLELVNATQYTLTFRIAQTGATEYTTTLSIYSGTNTSASALQSIFGTASGANILTDQFNAVAIGYRFSGTSAPSLITLNSLSVQQFSTVPEPSAFAALAGVTGLAFAAGRRRRSA